jgi:hypothetical protein
MRRNAVVRLLLVGAVVLAAVPSVGTAQPVSPDRPPLTDYERVDEVVVEDRPYTIYRYDSPLPYVGGLVVYRNGTSVDEGTATTVLEVYARQVAVANLRAEELATVREVRNDSRRVQETAGPAIETLGSAIAYTDRLRNESVGNRSAWTVAAERVPALEDGFGAGIGGGESDAAELRATLVRWERVATDVEENATAVVRTVQRRRNGTEIDKNRLYRRYAAMLSSLERLRSLTETVNRRVPATAETAGTVAESAGDVPEVGGTLADRFRTLADRFRTTAERAADVGEDLSSRRESLQRIQERATSIQERMRTRLAAEGAIESRLYATFVEGGVVLVAGLLAVAGRASGG